MQNEAVIFNGRAMMACLREERRECGSEAMRDGYLWGGVCNHTNSGLGQVSGNLLSYVV